MNKDMWKQKAAELYRLQLRRKYYAEEEARVAKELQELSNFESVEMDEWCYNRIDRKGAIAYSSIPFLKNMDLEEFRRPGSVAWALKKAITASDLDE